jgi:hypothetical protein
VADHLALSPRWERSSDLRPEGTADDRLISLTTVVAGDTYVSGAGGQSYQDEEKFRQAGLEIEVHEYVPVPYPQFADPFTPGLTILDALFHLGRDATRVLAYPLASSTVPDRAG